MADVSDPRLLSTPELIQALARLSMDLFASPDVDAEQIAELIKEAAMRLDRQHRLLNTPEIKDFAKAVVLEAAHQRERWKAQHDAGKTAWDWFWLLGYLGQKAASSAAAGDLDKARHHTISSAAALANWHLALSGVENSMRPGIASPETAVHA